MEIALSVHKTIPVAGKIFFNITLTFDGGEVYYFFNEEGKSDYVYNLYIPKQYGVPNSESEKMKDALQISLGIEGNL